MNDIQIVAAEHALKNGNRFYTDTNDKDWNDLVSKGYATKHSGWEDDMAYFRVSDEGKLVLSNCIIKYKLKLNHKNNRRY